MSTNWMMVPSLDEGLRQLDKRFPKRAKKAEGGIGDNAHKTRTSSHNPDDTAGVKAEHNDGDGKHEVRARDFDKNLNASDGMTMENVVQLWVKKAREGKMWWVRYIIFNGRIWHKRDNFVTHVYTGSNKHPDHAHVNGDFTQHADEVTGTNWYLDELAPAPKPPSSGPKPSKPAPLVVDGALGPKTCKRLQQELGVPQTGKMDSRTVRALQVKLRALVDHRLAVDGILGPKSIAAFQRYLKSPVDGVISHPRSQMVMALQRRLNAGKL